MVKPTLGVEPKLGESNPSSTRISSSSRPIRRKKAIRVVQHAQTHLCSGTVREPETYKRGVDSPGVRVGLPQL